MLHQQLVNERQLVDVEASNVCAAVAFSYFLPAALVEDEHRTRLVVHEVGIIDCHYGRREVAVDAVLTPAVEVAEALPSHVSACQKALGSVRSGYKLSGSLLSSPFSLILPFSCLP